MLLMFHEYYLVFFESFAPGQDSAQELAEVNKRRSDQQISAAMATPHLFIRILNRFFETTYSSLCRAYARLFMPGDERADAIMQLLIAIEFLKIHKYWPRIKNPRSFEEKLCHRMLFDRNPRWTELTDKLRVRDYIAEKVSRKYLIPLLWSGHAPEDIPFEILPSSFVIKTNHACGHNILVEDKSRLDRRMIERRLKKWLHQNYGRDAFHGIAWAYKNIQPAILIESFLYDEGKPPIDYKFFCFSGRVELLQMNFDRFGDAYEKTFDRDFRPLDLWQGTRQYPHDVVALGNYPDMVKVAEALAAGFDFIRADLYNVGGQIYVGELTCYPGGGYVRWIPREFEFILGKKWNLSVTI